MSPAPSVNPAKVKPTWTGRLRDRFFGELPPDKLLPDTQPAYMSSWVYLFGVGTVAALVSLIVTGLVLTVEGPEWYHVSSLGLFVNSTHFWSVQLFFFFMVLHLWGKFFMAAWRGKRFMTWFTGVLAFFVSIITALSGYLIQTNFDSQWIAGESKDGFNAVGIGAFFNSMNFGQMVLLHVSLLPITVSVLVGVHLLMVRRRGIVVPLDEPTDGAEYLNVAATEVETVHGRKVAS